MASSSSEEGEEEKKIMAEIAGCAAKDLTQAKLVNKQLENKDKNCSKRKLTSRRKDKGCEEAQDSYLTPECKRHIAKKLSSYLDACIQVKSSHTDFKPREMTSQVSGIHLFHSSRNKLLDMENDCLKEKQHKMSKRLHQSSSSSESSDNEDELARFQEAAVCGQSIIDKSHLSFDNGINVEEDNKKKNKKKKKEHKKDKKRNCISEYEFDHVKDRWK